MSDGPPETLAGTPLDVLRAALTGPGAPSHLPVHMVLDLVRDMLLRSDHTVDVVAAAIYAHRKIDREFRPLRCSCGGWDVNEESWDEHLTRVALTAIGGSDD